MNAILHSYTVAYVYSMPQKHWTFENKGKAKGRNRVTNGKLSYLEQVLATLDEHRGAHDGGRHVP